MSRATPDSDQLSIAFVYRTVTLFGLPFQTVLLAILSLMSVLYPALNKFKTVWALSRSLAAT